MSSKSSKVVINSDTEETTVSATLKETKEKLTIRGFTDTVLTQYCDQTPKLFEEFVKLFEAVKTIRQSFHSKDFVSPITDNILIVYETNSSNEIQLGNLLAALGFGEVCRSLYDKLVDTFPKICSYDHDQEDQENRDKECFQGQMCMSHLCTILANYADKSDDFCISVSEAGLISRLLDIVENMKDCIPHHTRFMDNMGALSQRTVRGHILKMALAAMHNMSKRVQTRASFAKCNAVPILLPLINNKVLDYAAIALLTLAYLTDDSNNKQIMANEGPIKFLISGIEQAIKYSSDHVYTGFSSEELAQGLAQIAVNDDNKKTIAANNVIPLTITMIQTAIRDEERIEAIALLWVLAFDEDNKAKMRETKGLVTLLKYWNECGNESIQKVASGALWEIEDVKRVGSGNKKHVMISYQWDVQKTIIQVKKKLESAGFNVWLDLEKMGGSILDTMAKAVENSAVVLVCVSQKYKESSNCRSEAEYARKLEKDIVPLMMQSNYNADGWLGIIMGTKLWIDLRPGQKSIEASVTDLIKELDTRGKQGGNNVVGSINVDTVDAVPPKIDISGWTSKDVMKWLQPLGLEVKKKNALQELNGSMLMELHNLRSECPGYYYSSLKEDIGLDNVFCVLKFSRELQKLLK